MGQWEEAIKATSEAILHYRSLIEQNPDAFVPHLAAGLNNLGTMLSEMGRQEEALGAIHEAVDKIWPFFERQPLIFARNTAIMLEQLLHLHASLQRPLSPDFKKRIVIFTQLTQS